MRIHTVATIALSVWIPGSPGGKKKKRESPLDFIENSALVLVTLLFPIFELIVHVVGTVRISALIVCIGCEVMVNALHVVV